MTELHQALLELLQAFDAVCQKHQIPYQLFAGTALGAVRHQGFIPWDDDLDVVMLREDYERFLAVAPRELDGEKYHLQAEYSAHWPMFFSKLRKNNTAFMERFVPKDPQLHQGVYMDIFPCDNLSEVGLVQRLQFLASKVVIAKGLDARGYRTDSAPKKLFLCLGRMLPGKPFWRFAAMRGRTDAKFVHTFFGGGSRFEKNIYPRAWFQETVMLPFEGRLYPVSAHYDRLLTRLYGDYMTPLPEEQRDCKIHAAIVDLHRPYTHYLDAQRTASDPGFSRSIR